MAVTINIKSTPPCIIRMQKSHTNTCINKKLSCVNRIEKLHANIDYKKPPCTIKNHAHQYQQDTYYS